MKRGVLVAIFALCFAAHSSAAEDSRRLKIGVIFPLSGKESRQGALGRIGIELALRELGDSFRPELFFEDSQSNAKDAVKAFNDLVSQRQVDAVLTMGSPAAMALLPLTNRQKVVLLAMAVASQFSVGDDFGFRLMGTAPAFSEEIRRTLAQLRSERIALLSSSDDYGSSYSAALSPALRADGKLVGEEEYTPGTTDFRPQLFKLKQRSPDALILAAWAQDAALIMKQAREIGFVPEVISCPAACDNPDVMTAGDAATENLLIVASSATISDQRRTVLREHFREPPTSVVLRFFDAIVLLKAASDRCVRSMVSHGECLKTEIASVQDLPGASYPIRFDTSGDIIESFQHKLVRRGMFVDADLSAGMLREYKPGDR